MRYRTVSVASESSPQIAGLPPAHVTATRPSISAFRPCRNQATESTAGAVGARRRPNLANTSLKLGPNRVAEQYDGRLRDKKSKITAEENENALDTHRGPAKLQSRSTGESAWAHQQTTNKGTKASACEPKREVEGRRRGQT